MTSTRTFMFIVLVVHTLRSTNGGDSPFGLKEGLAIEIPDERLATKISEPKEENTQRSPPKYLYTESEPDNISTSFVIQYFGTNSNKHYKVAKVLLDSLHSCAKVLDLHIEVLVNLDSSRTDKLGVDAWLSAAGKEDYIVLSPNIHELRGYNRLAGAAKGEFLFLMQDDRLPPSMEKDPTCKWLSEPLAVFK